MRLIGLKHREAIAKEHEREAINERISCFDREAKQTIQWIRQDYDKLLADMDYRIRKLEGNQPKE